MTGTIAVRKYVGVFSVLLLFSLENKDLSPFLSQRLLTTLVFLCIKLTGMQVQVWF